MIDDPTHIQNKITAYQDKTTELQDVINFKQDELDKKKVIIRKLDQALEAAHPPTEDVCLSARSYSENDLISARDDALAAKDKQIELLNERVESLMTNVDTIEATIPPLQRQLEEAEAAVDAMKKENKLLKVAAQGLERQIGENKGRKQAVKVAMEQVRGQ